MALVNRKLDKKTGYIVVDHLLKMKESEKIWNIPGRWLVTEKTESFKIKLKIIGTLGILQNLLKAKLDKL